jgi:excisionase family DNA binding protein
MPRVDAESGQQPATNRANWPDSDQAAAVQLESGHDVLDVPQVASLLAVGRNTIYALVAKNQIPHRRLGKAIRFSRAAVMSWLSSWSSQDAKERH